MVKLFLINEACLLCVKRIEHISTKQLQSLKLHGDIMARILFVTCLILFTGRNALNFFVKLLGVLDQIDKHIEGDRHKLVSAYVAVLVTI